MIDLAEADKAASMERWVGKQGEEEMAEILGKVYKVRPFGVRVVNMRGLNPSGKSSFKRKKKNKLTPLCRCRQTNLSKRSPPRPPSRLLRPPDLQPHPPRPHTSWQNYQATLSAYAMSAHSHSSPSVLSTTAPTSLTARSGRSKRP